MIINTQKLLLFGLLPIIFLVFLIIQDLSYIISSNVSSNLLANYIGLIILLFLGIYTFWSSIYSKEIIITSEEIRKNNIFRSKSIKWNEIDTFESSRYSMLIGNKNQYIVIPDYRYWDRENGNEGKKILDKYLRKNGINKSKVTIRSALPFDKGTNK